jgi:glycosyltransferase involved in cell wall biosynthesis
MRISVIIPVYNRQMLCQRAIRSVLTQQVDELEIVIIDDGSQPPFQLPLDMAESSHIRLLRLDENRGAAAARNVGVGAARGEWLAFLDSDDYWLAGTLRPRLEFAEKDWAAKGDQMILYAAGFVADNANTGRRSARIPVESANSIHFASGCWFAPGSTALCRKHLFVLIGPYDTQLRRLEDLDWFLRFALAGGQLKVWDDLAAVIEIGSKPQLSALEESAAHLKTKYAKMNNSNRLPPGLMRRLAAYLDIERASILAADGRWLGMLSYFAQSFLRVPRLTIHLERFWRYCALPQGRATSPH